MTEAIMEAESAKKEIPSPVELLTIAPLKPNFPFFTSSQEALMAAREYLGKQGEIVKIKCEEKQNLMREGLEDGTLDSPSSEFFDLSVEAGRLGDLMWPLVRLSRENSSETEVLKQIKAEIAAVESLRAVLGQAKKNKTLTVDGYQIDVAEARRVVEIYDSDETSGLKRIVRVCESLPPDTSPENLPIKAVESLSQSLSENIEPEIIILEPELKPEPKPEKFVEEAPSLEPEIPNAQILEEVVVPVALAKVKEVEKVAGVEVPNIQEVSPEDILKFIEAVRTQAIEIKRALSNEDKQLLKKLMEMTRARFSYRKFSRGKTTGQQLDIISMANERLSKLLDIGL